MFVIYTSVKDDAYEYFYYAIQFIDVPRMMKILAHRVRHNQRVYMLLHASELFRLKHHRETR